MKKSWHAVTLLAWLGVFSQPSAADVGNTVSPVHNPQIQSASKTGVEEERLKLDGLKQSVNQDVKMGLDKVQEAIPALNNSKPEEALKLLKEAVGSFDVALAASPSLGLTPVGSVVEVQEIHVDATTIKQQINLAKKLLDRGEIQDARAVLLPLRSDIAESVTYLPMATYPAAIRLAVRQITDGRMDQAQQTLFTATNTLVVAHQRVVPIPVLAARSLVDEASKMDKTKKEAIRAMLAEAQDQLQIAQLLGYHTDHSPEYRQTNEAIANIRAEIQGQNRVEMMYQSLNARLSAWIDAMTTKTKK